MLGIKKNLDKFYTKKEIAQKCINLSSSYLNNVDIVIEPSAGNGAFLTDSFLKNYKVIALDIAPENNNIEKQDFLKWYPNDNKKYAVIGNPPFGKRAAAAIAFFNHAAQFCDYICFIVPVSFMKWNTQKQLNKSFKLLEYHYLPLDSFLCDEKVYNIRCVFQIWGKDGENNFRLLKSPSITSQDFKLWQYNATKQSLSVIDEDWDYALYRQGYYDYNSNIFTRKDYERIKYEMTREKQKRQFFFVKPLTKEAERNFLSMDFNALAERNLVIPGFGKGDFVSYYNELFKK